MNLRTLIAVVALVVPAASANASEALRNELGKLAKAVVDIVGDKGTVKVGIFALKTTGLQEVNSGPGLEQVLTQEMEARRKGVVQPNAQYEINGDYVFAKKAPDDPTKVIKIKAQICDAQTGETVSNLPLSPVAIADNKSIAEILQISASLPPDGSYEDRNKKIEDAVRNPSVFVHPGGTQVSSSDKSTYSVEIRVKPQDAYQQKAAARPARVEKGQAYVDIKQGEIYEVHVYNNSGKEVAVSLSIDGIDEFHFSKDRGKEGRPAFSHWIMMKDATGKARQELSIPGWFNTAKDPSQTYLSFLVVGYGQGGVSKAGIASRGKVGVIRVGISECYPLRTGDSPKSGDETGFGPPVPGQVAAVHYGIGVEIDSVAVRYTRDQK